MGQHGGVHVDSGDPVVGSVGTLTVSIPAGGPGEVMIPIRGGSEAYAAWSDEPLRRHTRVLVVAQTGPRSVVVTPFDD